MTLKDEILQEADGEEIESIIIGPFGWSDINVDDTDENSYFSRIRGGIPTPRNRKGILISWEEAIPYLNYQYCGGYGAPECHALYAYTKNKVIFISEYDGSTHVTHLPRNPTECIPHMI